MSKPVIVDTGPLLAALASGLEHGEWVGQQLKRLRPPLLTCEAVLTEENLARAFGVPFEGRDGGFSLRSGVLPGRSLAP